jgi:class 3 adenylate cyclase
MAEAHPGRVGRRLAAIVAADVAGYSRLMGLDEVGTAAHFANTARLPMLSWRNTADAS